MAGLDKEINNICFGMDNTNSSIQQHISEHNISSEILQSSIKSFFLRQCKKEALVKTRKYKWEYLVLDVWWS